MSFKYFIIIFIINILNIFLFAKNKKQFHISNYKMSFNNAIMYCSDNMLYVAKVNNKIDMIKFMQVKGNKTVWLMMYEGVFFNDECMLFAKTLYPSKNCSEFQFAACTN